MITCSFFTEFIVAVHVLINILFSPQVMAGTVQKPPEFEEALERKRASLVTQLVKNPLAMWETWVRSPGWEEPLEKGKATHSSILAWRIP